MTDERDRPVLDRLLAQIPGFKGYVREEDRQRSDAQMRKFVHAKLLAAKLGLDGFARRALDAGQIDQMGRCDSLRKQIDRLASRLERITPGASSFFGRSLSDESLEDLYDFDAQLMDFADAVASHAERLATENDVDGSLLGAIEQQLTRLELEQERRENFLADLKD